MSERAATGPTHAIFVNEDEGFRRDGIPNEICQLAKEVVPFGERPRQFVIPGDIGMKSAAIRRWREADDFSTTSHRAGKRVDDKKKMDGVFWSEVIESNVGPLTRHGCSESLNS